MKIKRTALFAASMAAAIGAQAQLVMSWKSAGNNNDLPYTTATVALTNIAANSAPESFDTFGFTANTAVGFGGTGNLTVEFSAGDAFNETTWTFNPTNFSSGLNKGLGVRSAVDGGTATRQRGLNGSEVIEFTIDTSSFNDGGGQLQFRVTEGAGGLTLFEQTGASAGVVLQTTIDAVTPCQWYNVDGLKTFAVERQGNSSNAGQWGTLEFKVLVENVVPPLGLKISTANSRVQLGWDAEVSEEFDHYNVYRSSITNVLTVSDLYTSLTTNTFTDSGVTNDVTYYYAVSTVGANSGETALSFFNPATPFVTAPGGLVLVPSIQTDQRVELDWNDSATNDLYFGSYNVYRAGPNTDANIALLESGVTASSYVDTNSLANDVRYYYWVSHAALNPVAPAESALIGPVAGLPTKNLIVLNYGGDGFGGNGNQQGEVRVKFDTNTVGSVWGDFTTTPVTFPNRLRAGITHWYNDSGYNLYLDRSVLLFRVDRSRLVNRTADDIERVTLRLFVPGGDEPIVLTNDTAQAGSKIECYHALSRPLGALATADWTNGPISSVRSGWDYVGDMPGLVSGAPTNVWYEIDVTAQVLADLAQETEDGTSFQLRMNDDLNVSTNRLFLEDEPNPSSGFYDGVAYGVTFSDNVAYSASAPQLYVKYKDNRSGYLQWADVFLPTVIGPTDADYDMDGFDNTYEYGLGGNPTDDLDIGTLPAFTKVGGGFKYIHPKRSDDSKLVYTVETTSNLQYIPFTNMGYTVEGTFDTGNALDFVTNNVDMTDNQRFIRLRIEYNP